ncbi:MAG TPA: hypothetical protein VFV75_00395 [Candidatus Polarisedimenticolaceae bacterium]|nr:hypothetical protein [Candidatus Polarisedimenticolaceae bacterium]
MIPALEDSVAFEYRPLEGDRVRAAYQELTALDPPQLPDPALAAEARVAAVRHRDIVRIP